MGFRFRRTIRILPGVRLNIGKTGVSTSVGVRGAHVTIGHGKVRKTVGIPGTGLSYTDVSDARNKESEPGRTGGSVWIACLLLVLVLIGIVVNYNSH